MIDPKTIQELKVYPPIGVARVGNAAGANDFIIGPETIGGPPTLPGGSPERPARHLFDFRTATGELKRQAARFRVSHLHADGKVELSLRAHAHEELENDAETVLRIISKPGALPVGDHSSPEQLRELFGLSKKAFKRAAGRLLKQGLVSLDQQGCLVKVRAPG